MGSIISFFRREKTINYKEVLEQLEKQINELEKKKKLKEQSRRNLLIKTYLFCLLFWSLWLLIVYLDNISYFSLSSFSTDFLIPLLNSLSFNLYAGFHSILDLIWDPESDPNHHPSHHYFDPPSVSDDQILIITSAFSRNKIVRFVNIFKFVPVILIPLSLMFFTKIVNSWSSKQIHSYDMSIQELMKAQRDKVNELKATIDFATVQLIQKYETKFHKENKQQQQQQQNPTTGRGRGEQRQQLPQRLPTGRGAGAQVPTQIGVGGVDRAAQQIQEEKREVNSVSNLQLNSSQNSAPELSQPVSAPSSTSSSPRPGYSADTQEMPRGELPSNFHTTSSNIQQRPSVSRSHTQPVLQTIPVNQPRLRSPQVAEPQAPKTTIDRLMDWIIGDGHDYTVPKICERCNMFNGNIHKDAAPNMVFVCGYCQHFNQRGEQRSSNETDQSEETKQNHEFTQTIFQSQQHQQPLPSQNQPQEQQPSLQNQNEADYDESDTQNTDK